MSLRTPVMVAGLLAAAVLSGCAANGVPTGEVTRYKIPGSSFPISNAVEVSPGVSTVYLSGKVLQRWVFTLHWRAMKSWLQLRIRWVWS